MKKQINFDMNTAIKGLREGKDGVLTPLIKQMTEAVLQAGLETHLAEQVKPYRNNGRTSKT